jgi:hypothetical protein
MLMMPLFIIGAAQNSSGFKVTLLNQSREPFVGRCRIRYRQIVRAADTARGLSLRDVAGAALRSDPIAET